MDQRQRDMDALEKALRRVFREIKKDIDAILGPELTGGEFAALKFLNTNGAQKASALAKAFDVTPSHMTALTDRLVEKQLIERTRSTADRRIVQLKITDRGKRLIDRLSQKKTAYFRKKFDHLSNEEMEQLVNLLGKLVPEENIRE